MTEVAQEQCAGGSAPTAAHEKLKPFVGAFRAEVRVWMGPGDPQVSTGVMVNELDLGGRFLRQSFKGDAGAGPFPNFEGRGYWGFNTVTNKYEGFWIDTASTIMQTETGEADAAGKVWTMKGQMPGPQGGTMKKKSVITLKDRDHHGMDMFFEGPDGKETKGMEIRYTRVAKG